MASSPHRMWPTKPCGDAEGVRDVEIIMPHKMELSLLHMGVVRRTSCDASQLAQIAAYWCRKGICVGD